MAIDHHGTLATNTSTRAHNKGRLLGVRGWGRWGGGDIAGVGVLLHVANRNMGLADTSWSNQWHHIGEWAVMAMSYWWPAHVMQNPPISNLIRLISSVRKTWSNGIDQARFHLLYTYQQ